MGDKRRYLSEENRLEILNAYQAFEESEISKIVTAVDLGFRDVPVSRVRRLATEVTDEAIENILAKPGAASELTPLLRELDGVPWIDLPETLRAGAKALGVKMPLTLIDHIMNALAVDDLDAPPAVDRKGNPVIADGSKMTERIPLTEDVTEHMERDVLPFAPDATWDEAASKVGYEIPFTRLFYKPTELRPLEEIDADVLEVMQSLAEKFKAVRER